MVSLMHGVYALGASGAPLIIAASASPSTWRIAYLAVGVGFALVFACWNVSPARATLSLARQHPATVRSRVPRTGRVLLAIAAFFAVSGLEIAVGAWAAVYLTDALAATPSHAARGVLGYWCAVSVARLSAGVGASRRPRAWVAGGCLMAITGAAVLCLASTMMPVVVGLTLLGAGVGPLLPMLTILTPDRVGRDAAARMIGWQMAAASVGAALISSGVGLVVHHTGVRAIGPAIAVVAVATAAVVGMLERRTGR
jgi:fucose permease